MSENVFLAYFGELASKFKPSSLWSIYSLLRTVLSIRNDTNIANYQKLKSFLKRQSDGFKSKKSKILTAEDINKFIKEAPDYKYLFSELRRIARKTIARKTMLENNCSKNNCSKLQLLENTIARITIARKTIARIYNCSKSQLLE